MMAIPTNDTFKLVQSLNFDEIERLSIPETRLILPCLSRMCLCETLDLSNRWKDNRKKLKGLLLAFPEVDDIVQLLKFDYGQLESEVKREMQLRFKVGSNPTDSFLLPPGSIRLENGVIIAFENCDMKMRMKIVLHELIQLMGQTRNYSYSLNQTNAGPFASELFDCDIYLDEFIDLIYFAISEMPNSFQLVEVVEAFLIVKNGRTIICRLVANFTDSFHEVCMTLINNCESIKIEEDSFYSINRVNVLRTLCQMNLAEALTIRGEAVELCRMPNLVIMLTLDHIKQNPIRICGGDLVKREDNDDDYEEEDDTICLDSKTDVISFFIGILLSDDDKVRTWFAQYIKASNQKQQKQTIEISSNNNNSINQNNSNSNKLNTNIFMEFRLELLERFKSIIDVVSRLSSLSSSMSSNQSSSTLILTEACIMLRMYCALRGVASMKFMDEETLAICRLIVCRPPHSYSGVRFVSFGLCMILAFPQLVTVPENEIKIVEWIKWLVQEESYFGKVSGIKSSFGEMLLLIAIHFHSNQMSAIGELISSTIGIKLPIRTNDLNRIKHIFTQEIFTDQTVTAHAIKVPVTKNLNNSISGFVPVHCIYQLLKSRAFTKHKVPIKDWIFKQIRNCVAPIHPILPSLIEAYVNSIIIPSNSQSSHLTNEAISEEEIFSIFNRKVYSIEDDEDDEDEDFDEDSNNSESSSDDSAEDEDESKMDVDHLNKSNQDCGHEEEEEPVDNVSCLLTSQLLLLYYVLLYQDVRLSNFKTTSGIQIDRKVLRYSDELISQLPIFYLIQKTRTCPSEYGVLMAPLLRLLAFHYPHLCLDKDWLPRSNNNNNLSTILQRSSYSSSSSFQNKNLNHHRTTMSPQSLSSKLSTKRERIQFLNVFKLMNESVDQPKQSFYNQINKSFERLLCLPDEYLWPLAPDFISKLALLLDDSVPKVVCFNVRNIWFRLNRIFPTKLWLMTVNALSQSRNESGRHFNSDSYGWGDLIKNPLDVLKCDRRVFRLPELMEITLHMLNGFLSASAISNTHYVIESSNWNRSMVEEDKKRDDLKQTYQSLTKSAAIQLLLECCLLTEADFEKQTNIKDRDTLLKGKDCSRNNILSNFREIQGLICNHLHQCFISDTNLAKLVHFQGYERRLLSLVVSAVPSAHICLDFIPELLNMEDLSKQSFAIDLCSHLAVQYPIQRSLDVSALCLQVADVHLSLLPSNRRTKFFLSTLPAFERICKVFQPFVEEFLKFLIPLARQNALYLADKSTIFNVYRMPFTFEQRSFLEQTKNDVEDDDCSMFHQNFQSRFSVQNLLQMDWFEFEERVAQRKLTEEEALLLAIQKTFAMICHHSPTVKLYADNDI